MGCASNKQFPKAGEAEHVFPGRAPEASQGGMPTRPLPVLLGSEPPSSGPGRNQKPCFDSRKARSEVTFTPNTVPQGAGPLPIKAGMLKHLIDKFDVQDALESSPAAGTDSAGVFGNFAKGDVTAAALRNDPSPFSSPVKSTRESFCSSFSPVHNGIVVPATLPICTGFLRNRPCAIELPDDHMSPRKSLGEPANRTSPAKVNAREFDLITPSSDFVKLSSRMVLAGVATAEDLCVTVAHLLFNGDSGTEENQPRQQTSAPDDHQKELQALSRPRTPQPIPPPGGFGPIRSPWSNQDVKLANKPSTPFQAGLADCLNLEGIARRDLAYRLDALSNSLRPRPNCANDLAILQTRISRGLYFLNVELPRAVATVGLEGVLGENALLRALMSDDKNQFHHRPPEVLKCLPDSQRAAAFDGARTLRRLVRANARNREGFAESDPDVRTIKPLLSEGRQFFADLLESANQQGVVSWDLYEELVQLRVYLGCIDRESETRSSISMVSSMASLAASVPASAR